MRKFLVSHSHPCQHHSSFILVQILIYTHYRDENHPQYSSHETQPLFSLPSKEFAGEIIINTEQRTLTGIQRVWTNIELLHPRKSEQILPAPPGSANPQLICPSGSCISNNIASKETGLLSSWEPLKKHMRFYLERQIFSFLLISPSNQLAQ